ncbi:endonuclease/exonuclease/phosphatase family protein [Palleronia rufa]|uniref:endonuclease/exonuclease/phosphatase family protein n=1 Tax=Palleronia rufa TaxID=1530186 RepID=UPI000689F586|nr:endonuclease/exonuclease/phosphatase family protein [Palleronia rufa]
MQTVLDLLITAAALLAVVGTIMPILPTHQWWIRAWDFPRLQIAIVGLIALVLSPLATPPLGWALGVPALLATLWQAVRIYPFSPFARTEMTLVSPNDSGSQVTLVSSNVEMPNERHGDVLRLIDDIDPDMLLLMEPNARWHAALKDRLAAYETVATEIRENYYGMIFCTRLKVHELDIVYLSHDDTPTLFAELETPAGQVFRVVGLHPRPPVPGNDTDDRDAEILFAARFAKKDDVPLIAVGDFNDAAWSSSSRTFKRVGEYLDPRVGRGMVASFDANRRWLRVPIDQLYVTKEVAVSEFRRGPHVGSDHFPLIARIDLDREAARRANGTPPKLPATERDEIDRIVDTYREALERSETD